MPIILLLVYNEHNSQFCCPLDPYAANGFLREATFCSALTSKQNGSFHVDAEE